VAEVKIGPIGARFKGTVTLSDLDAPNGYTISGQGNGGVAGNAKGGAKVRLSDDGAGTLVSYDVEAEVGGRMAQLGGPLIDATAKQMAGRFFAKFGEVVGAGEAALAAAAAPAPAVEAAVAPVAGAPAAAAPTVVVQAPASVPAPASAPWAWIVATGLAIIAGFLLGRSQAGEAWMVAMVILVLVAGAAGYAAGRSGGRS
jgi:hypothetical protein